MWEKLQYYSGGRYSQFTNFLIYLFHMVRTFAATAISCLFLTHPNSHFENQPQTFHCSPVCKYSSLARIANVKQISAPSDTPILMSFGSQSWDFLLPQETIQPVWGNWRQFSRHFPPSIFQSCEFFFFISTNCFLIFEQILRNWCGPQASSFGLKLCTQTAVWDD